MTYSEEQAEVIEEDVEVDDPLETMNDDTKLPMLSIGSDLGNEGDSFERRSEYLFVLFS